MFTTVKQSGGINPQMLGVDIVPLIGCADLGVSIGPWGLHPGRE
ncbi:MAG: hypothetical protein ACQEQO_03700 [Thermodesulfobacteriota bacterium]